MFKKPGVRDRAFFIDGMGNASERGGAVKREGGRKQTAAACGVRY
jgi:hypothetical protein